MEYGHYLASIIGPVLAVMGLSALMYSKVWVKLLKYYTENHFRVFGLAFVELILGLLVVTKYNVWETNVYLIVTIVGWGMILESVMYMLLPGDTLKNMMKKFSTPGAMSFLGLVMLVAGGALCYHVYMM